MSLTINVLVLYFFIFEWVFGGALFSVYLRGTLPEHHSSDDSKDTVSWGWDRSCPLLAEMRESAAQRSAGDLHQSLERRVHFLDPGDVYPLPGTDPDLRRSDPDRPDASRPVKGVNLLRRWFWVRVPVDPRCTPRFCGHRVTYLNADGNT